MRRTFLGLPMNAESNSISYISAFLGGLLVSFSPCVYPLIPVVLGFIGIRKDTLPARGLLLSLLYVVGLAVTYSVLGLIAVFSGSFFGRISAHPVSYLVVGNACIIAALSFFEVIQFPSFGIRLQGKIKAKQEYLAAFLFGLTSGLVIGPCTAPALGVILVYVASRQNIFYGMSLLFTFALGMGILLILAGTAGSLLLNLAFKEAWLARIKKLSGFILLGMGEYFIIQAGRALL